MILTELEKKEYNRYLKEYSFCKWLKNKNILITGSNGMTGTGIIKWILYENEHNNMNCHVYASTRNPNVLPKYVESSDLITMCRYGEEKSFLNDISIDYIIHAAAPTGRKFFTEFPVETIRTIVDSTEVILEIARDKNAQMVYLSSVEAYGIPNTNTPLKETFVGAVDSLDIRSGYPLGKKAAEFLCYAMFKEYGTNVKIVRPSSIQGLLQPYDEQRIFNEILRCMIEQRNLVMRSDGSSKKSIVYTLDAVTGILLVLVKGISGETYNITDPKTYFSMKDLTENLFNRFRPSLCVEFDIEDCNKTGYLPHLEFTQDVSKIEKLGWRCLTNLNDIYGIDIERFSK